MKKQTLNILLIYIWMYAEGIKINNPNTPEGFEKFLDFKSRGYRFSQDLSNIGLTNCN